MSCSILYIELYFAIKTATSQSISTQETKENKRQCTYRVNSQLKTLSNTQRQQRKCPAAQNI